jgi:hypothetical protein
VIHLLGGQANRLATDGQDRPADRPIPMLVQHHPRCKTVNSHGILPGSTILTYPVFASTLFINSIFLVSMGCAALPPHLLRSPIVEGFTERAKYKQPH